MHALFIPSWYPAHRADFSGCFFREQALALRDDGVRIGVITPAFRSITHWRALVDGGYGLQWEHDSGIETLRFQGVRAFSWNHDLNMAFWERTGLRAYHEYRRRHGRPDVVHVHAMIFGLAWAAAIHHVHGIPFLVTEHSSEYECATIAPSLQAYLVGRVARASRTFGVSSHLTASLNAQVPLPPGRSWEVMHNMVSPQFGTAARTLAADRSAARTPTLLSVAGLYVNKGHHHLLRALRMVVDAGVDVRLRIIGSGPEEARLNQLTDALELNERVVFLGRCGREEVAQEMAAADALVISSSYETFGIVAAEALLSGKPVLTTRCGGPEDIVIADRDGYLVEKDDPAALAAGLAQLVRSLDRFDPNELHRRCVERFSAHAFARRLTDVYGRIASAAVPEEVAS